MARACDHCGEPIATGASWVGGREGAYCSAVCCYDHEVLDVDADELAPSEGVRRVESE